jgi:hypothetical protein
MKCPCGEQSPFVCSHCGVCPLNDALVDLCPKCSQYTCGQCPRICKCGHTVPPHHEYQCDATYCRADGAVVDTVCPACNRAFHTACVQPCRWCDFGNGTMCPCQRGAYYTKTREWTASWPIAAPFVQCPHGPNQTYDTFQYRHTDVRWHIGFAAVAGLLLMLLMWWWSTELRHADGHVPNKYKIAKDMAVWTMISVLCVGLPLYLAWRKITVDIPRAWRDMQAAAVKDV